MELTYKSTIDSFRDLEDLCWSGAQSRLAEISNLDLEEEFFEYLCEQLEWREELTLTDINDFIWFEVDDWIEEHKGDSESED